MYIFFSVCIYKRLIFFLVSHPQIEKNSHSILHVIFLILLEHKRQRWIFFHFFFLLSLLFLLSLCHQRRFFLFFEMFKGNSLDNGEFFFMLHIFFLLARESEEKKRKTRKNYWWNRAHKWSWQQSFLQSV